MLGPAGRTLPAFHWHLDTFELPVGATLLASSAAHPHQAFQVCAHTYGLQFHVEVNVALALA